MDYRLAPEVTSAPVLRDSGPPVCLGRPVSAVAMGLAHLDMFGLAPAPLQDQDVARQNDLIYVPDPVIQRQSAGAQSGGSARGY